MSGVSLPVTRPSGRALVVGNAAGRVEAMGLGADGLLSGEGLHRIAMSGNAAPTSYAPGPSVESPVSLPRPMPSAATREEPAPQAAPAEPQPHTQPAAAPRTDEHDDAN